MIKNWPISQRLKKKLKLKEIDKQQLKEQKAKLRDAWNEWSSSAPVPTRETVTSAEAEFLQQTAIAVAFSAEEVK